MYKKNKTGFLLITCIVYSALLVLVMATALRLSVLIIPQAYSLIDWCSYTDFYAAYDALYKDFCCAPSITDAWYKADNNGFIWRVGSRHHGWLIVDNNLLYKEGIYDVHTTTWSDCATSLIARDVQLDIVECVVKKNRVQRVSCRAYISRRPEHSWYCGRVFYDAS